MTSQRSVAALSIGIAAAALSATAGAAAAVAAPMPTIAVAAAGDTDWQITYHRGTATRRDARCRVWLDDRVVASPEATPPLLATTTLAGADVAPGAHRINVRCGRTVSPTLWLIAPRNQIFDGVTWLSNGTAGLLGY